MAPEAAAEAMRAYAEETNRINRERRASGAGDRKKLARVEKKIAAMIAVIEDGGYVLGMMDRLRELEARRAGLPPAVVDGLSGHSTRVGTAQDMIAASIELPAILQAGRWKSPAMVNRYGERLLACEGAAAQLARIQRRGA